LYDSSVSKCKKSYESDSKAIEKIFRKIGQSKRVSLRLKRIDAQKWSIKDIRRWLSKVRPVQDTIVVTYSGPERHDPNNLTKWPSISLSQGKGSLIVSIKRFLQLAQEKRPRLVMVFADCYNKFYKISRNEGLNLKNPIKTHQARAFFYRHWETTKGFLLACSHRKGDVGYGLNNGMDQQGLFTHAYLNSIMRSAPGAFSGVLKSDMYLYSPAHLHQKMVCQSLLRCTFGAPVLR
jgi:hypothetical protein